jgi:type I restriction enzyme S subunit
LRLTTRSINQTSGIQNLDTDRYLSEEVAYPPPDEQSNIATFLDRETDKIDTLISKQVAMIDLLKEKRQAVISHAVTKGLDQNVSMKPSSIEWLGDVPEHWTITKLDRQCTKIGDGLHGTPTYVDRSGIHFINGNNLVDGGIRITESTKCVSAEEMAGQKIELGDGTILISINGTIGNTALYFGELVMLGKSAGFINCSDSVSRRFVHYFLNSSAVRCFFDTEVTGTTIFNLSLESIRNIPIVFPSILQQEEIVCYLDKSIAKIEALIAKAQQAIALQKEHRTALISAAVTGKIDVRDQVDVKKAA